MANRSSSNQIWSSPGKLYPVVDAGSNTILDGKTGRTFLNPGKILVGNGGSPIMDDLIAPNSNLVGINDAQVLTNKVINTLDNTVLIPIGLGSVNLNSVINQPVTTSAAPTFTGVNVDFIDEKTLNSGIFMDAGSVLVKDGNVSANIFTANSTIITNTVNTTGSNVTVNLPKFTSVGVDQTATRVLTLDGSDIVKTRSGPTSAIVGVNDTQTLTNKTMTSISNSIDATLLLTRPLSGVATTDRQLLRYDGVNWVPYLFAIGGMETLVSNVISTTILALNVFTQIAGTVALNVDSIAFTMPVNGVLQCTRTGKYMVSYSVSVQTGAQTTGFACMLYLNGIQVVRSTTRSHIHNNSGAGHASNRFSLNLISGDQLTIRISATEVITNLTVNWYNIWADQY